MDHNVAGLVNNGRSTKLRYGKLTKKHRKKEKERGRKRDEAGGSFGGPEFGDGFLFGAARASDVKFDGRDILMFTE